MLRKRIENFFKLESSTSLASGILLFLASFCAILIANSTATYKLYAIFSKEITFIIEALNITKSLTIRDLVNDVLMSVFFFLISLELKKEILIGELSTRAKATLPTIAAIGGTIFPAIIFFCFNFGYKENLVGTAIPIATDIAFAYIILSLFGKRIPNSLKIFLIALAVIDDLIAIVLIAIFYTRNLNLFYLSCASLPILGLVILNLRNSKQILLYLTLGVFLWLALFQSGIHVTLAAIIAAMFIPIKIKNDRLLENIAHKITPTVNFAILPIFAFVNAGVKVENLSSEVLFHPIALGTALGLFLGKQVGVMLFSFLAIRFQICSLPKGSNWQQFYSTSIFTGIGFTMSLFINALAFGDNLIAFDLAKIGILLGSITSMVFGALIAYFSFTKK